MRVNATNFPDEDFHNWVLTQEYGSDRVLTDSELAGISDMDVSKSGIHSLKGIEYFTALEALYCYGNQLTSLYVSRNTALTKLDCGRNQLTVLDVSKNTKLVNLLCFENQLTALDVLKNTKLTELYCSDNLLTALDMSKNTKLTELLCYKNQIKDEAMDALVESLSTVSSGFMYVIYNENEGNVMTTEQVTVAKSKGWTSYYFTGEKNEFRDEIWKEYEGIDPDGIGVVGESQSAKSHDIYNLARQRVGKPRRGLNIADGKKILIK